MKTSLHKDLGSAGWHSSVMTTYSVDPAFYDMYIERRLRRYGCENNMLLADAAMLTKALQATPDAFRSAGRRYAIVPVSVPGCFHPKVHLRLGADKARLIVGSANATAAGWCRNLEVLGDLDWRSRDTERIVGSLIRKAYDYLMQWLGDAPGDAVAYKCRLHLRDSPWLRDLEANSGAVELADGSAIDLLCERGGSSPSILRQLVGHAAGERIRKLIVVSPYWDTKLHGLRALRNALSDCPTIIALNPEKNSFPTDALRSRDDLQFVLLKAGVDSRRFPHAKVILIETAAADHVLFGSTNCSDDALGLLSGAAKNAEVSVYRRLKPGTIRAELSLDMGVKLRRDAIQRPAASSLSVEKSEVSFNAGYIELADRAVHWYPSAGIDPAGAVIRIGEVQVSPALTAGIWRGELPAVPKGPLIGRVILKSGRISAPTIVHEEIVLRRAAPGQIDRRLRDVLNHIRAGSEDLLDLAQHAHVIFAPDPRPGPRRRERHGGPGRQKVSAKATSYNTPEEFRRAITLEAATGATGQFSVDDPGLLQVLSIVMRGITGIGAQAEVEAGEDEDDRALVEGDTEDGDEQLEGEQDDSDEGDGASQPSSSLPIQYFTERQIDRRRKRLMKAMNAFQELLGRLEANPSLVSNRLAAQTAFMIQLMVLACTFDHRRQEGESVRLMVLFPTHPSEREYSFALRVTRMLRTIWVGKSNDPIARHIFVDARHKSLPDDIVAWIVLSRWAIARAHLAGSSAGGDLAGKIGEVARKVYLSSASLGPIAPEVETSTMRELDARLGVTPEETEAFLQYCNLLRGYGVTCRVA